MKKEKHEISWFNFVSGVVLICAGIFLEPLAAVLGILIVAVSMASEIIEKHNCKALIKEMQLEQTE